MEAKYKNSQGSYQVTEMGCFGLGVTRILAAIAELSADKFGICWPQAVAPYRVLLVPKKSSGGLEDSEKSQNVEQFYDELDKEIKNEVVIEDRAQLSFGLKMREASLVGFPYLVVFDNSQKVQVYKRVHVNDNGTEEKGAEWEKKEMDREEALRLLKGGNK